MPKSELVIQIGGKRKQASEIPHEEPDGNLPKNASLAEKSFKSMTWRERWQFTRELITVEPLVASFILGNTITQTALNNLQLEKSCRVDAAFNDTVCEAILGGEGDAYPHEIETVHLNITSVTSWLVPLCTVIPLVLSLFWGAFSDRHQIRKPFLLLPMFGELVIAVFCILSVIYMDEWDLATYGLLAYFVPSFFGGQIPLLFAIFAYIADVSTLEQRTLRVAFGQIVIQICIIIGQPLSGILFAYIGYYGIFILYFVIILLGILYGMFVLKEHLQPRDVDDKKKLFLDLFNPHHIVDIFSLLLAKKKGNNRLHIIIIMFIMFLNSGVGAGESNLFLLYLNSNLKFTAETFTYLLAFNTLVHLKGNIIGIWLFTKVLKLGDYTLLNITFLDKIVANIFLALAASTIMLYVGIYISLFTGITVIAVRSLATKVVNQADLGKAQSFFGIFEVLGATVMVPVYTQLIYPNIISTYPSAFFFASIIFLVLCILLVFFMQWSDRKSSSKDSKQLEGVDNPGMIMADNQTTHI